MFLKVGGGRKEVGGGEKHVVMFYEKRGLAVGEEMALKTGNEK